MAEALVILLLILMNGLLAGTEIAVLSARRPLLVSEAAAGDRRAQRVLGLLDDPSAFLSSVQVGITLVGILAGAFGGADAVRYLGPLLLRLPIPGIAAYAEPLAIGLVVLTITYLTLIIGELVPKRLALYSPETISRSMARPMLLLASVARPVVWVLSRSTDLVLRMLGVTGVHRPSVTEDEVRYLVAEGARTGVFVPAEQEFVDRIFRFADESVADVMRPRPDVVGLDIDEPVESIRQKLLASGYSRFPVYRGDLSDVLGVVHAKDLLSQEGPLSIQSALREPLFVPETKSLLGMLQTFQETHSQIAIVINEFGGTEGVVTLEDVLEEIVGEIRDEYDLEEPSVRSREDGSLLVDGSLSIPDLKEVLDLPHVEGEDTSEFRTLGGLLMAHLHRVPQEGDKVESSGFCFEVVDMDGLRVDKVLVRPTEDASPDPASSGLALPGQDVVE
jgi:putative hemolysin